MKDKQFREITDNDCEVCCEPRTKKYIGSGHVFSSLCDACLSLLFPRARVRYGSYQHEGNLYIRTDKQERYADLFGKKTGVRNEYLN